MMSKGKGISTNPNQGNGDWKVVGQGQRKPHEVRISTYASVLGGSDPNKGPEKSEIKMPTEAKNFVSGNPFVEITKGILHLYKDKYGHLKFGFGKEKSLTESFISFCWVSFL